MDKYYLTQKRLGELENDLEELTTKKRQEIAERLKTAKEYGDLSENSEYAAAKEEQAKVEARIFELEEILKNVKIIEKQAAGDDVKIGSTVSIKKANEILTYSIVGSQEAKPERGRISNESPLGKALLGRKVGDKVTFRAPSGEIACQIIKIE